MKKTLLLAFCAGLASFSVFSQASEFLDTGNVRAGFAPGLVLFAGDSVTAGSLYEVPKGSGVKSIFSSSFLLTAVDGAGNLTGAGDLYSRTMHAGPVATNYNNAYAASYDRVWMISKPEILAHIAHYADAGYSVPAHIFDWPGNGNSANGEAAILAPFVDRNGNGRYEPMLGDFPDVCGDQAVFIMLNDDAPGSAGLPGNAMRVELHILAYALASPDTAIANTVFLTTTVFNRSAVPYSNLLFSNFVEPDLGCGMNDRMGCDTALSCFYVYNDPNSPDSGACYTGESGYGRLKATQGFVFLNRRLAAYLAPGSGGSPVGAPAIYSHLRNFQTGRWNDGSPLTYGGNGYQSSFDTVAFQFPGDPALSAEWSELHPQWTGPPIVSGDRKAIATVALPDIAPGQSATVSMAYVTSFAEATAQPLSELSRLRSDISAVRQRFAQGTACYDGFPTSIPTLEAATVTISPNPAQGFVSLRVPLSLVGSAVVVTDVAGRQIHQQVLQDTTVIPLDGLTPGIYLLRLGGEVRKVIKE